MVLVAAVTVLIMWCAVGSQEGDALRSLSPDERRALFDATWNQMKIECAPASRGGFGKQCRQSSERVLLFPECDARCLETARAHLPSPTR